MVYGTIDRAVCFALSPRYGLLDDLHPSPGTLSPGWYPVPRGAAPPRSIHPPSASQNTFSNVFPVATAGLNRRRGEEEEAGGQRPPPDRPLRLWMGGGRGWAIRPRQGAGGSGKSRALEIHPCAPTTDSPSLRQPKHVFQRVSRSNRRFEPAERRTKRRRPNSRDAGRARSERNVQKFLVVSC